ncbi:MAG: hypothetical protein KDA24_07100 [Deltaproteobacteria bacterium]|nr:hypothetical protein [Deltaproteobacteria bacterium]
MSEGENRQLLIATAVALLVLGGGAFLWFGQTAETSRSEPLDTKGRSLTPMMPPTPATVTGGAPREAATPMDPMEAAKTAEKNRRRNPLPSMVPGLKSPSVRPPALTQAVYASLQPLEADFQACYDTALKADRTSKGRAILMFNVENGALQGDVSVELRAIPSVELRDCFGDLVPKADFSGVQGLARVLWPLAMWPERGLVVQAPVEDE